MYTEEEWRERFSAFEQRTLRTVLVLLAVCYCALIIPIVVATASVPDVPIEVPVFLLIMMTFVVWVPGITNVLMSRYRTARMPAPGLYEAGVQLGPLLFVPYGEVESLEPVDRGPGGGGRGRKAIRLHPRFKRRPFPGAGVQGLWFLNVEFLGDEGFSELERRVMGPVEGDREPPRLVLYGRRGASR